jgi:DNA-binding response OmpR family regulator
VKPNADVKVLVVEDDPFFQRVLEKRLRAEGYQVLTAADGREGMRHIVASEPDLVLSDWMMPEVDGLELCQSVKTGLREAAPYFILLTAKGEISDRLLGLETGADDYLVKPCDQGEIMARVRSGLRIVLLNQKLRHTVRDLTLANAELENARAQLERHNGPKARCPSCGVVRDVDGEWLEPGHYVARRASEAPAVECPRCAAGREGEKPAQRRATGD